MAGLVQKNSWQENVEQQAQGAPRISGQRINETLNMSMQPLLEQNRQNKDGEKEKDWHSTRLVHRRLTNGDKICRDQTRTTHKRAINFRLRDKLGNVFCVHTAAVLHANRLCGRIV